MKSFLLESTDLFGLLELFFKDYEKNVSDHLSFTAGEPEDLYNDILISIIEEALMGCNTALIHSVGTVMNQMTIPDEEANAIISLTKDMFLSALNRIHNEFIPDEGDYVYNVELFSTDSILIERVEVKKIKPDPVDVLKAQIKESIDNGDYYPEKVRKLIGL